MGEESLLFKTNKRSPNVLLHGNLRIRVKQATSLPNMDRFHVIFGDGLRKIPGVPRRKIEGHMTSDPYVKISVGGAVIGRTFVIRNNEKPMWKQHFNVPVAHYAEEVRFEVKDDDSVGSKVIGAVGIPAEQLRSGKRIEGSFPILGADGKPCKAGSELSLSIKFTPLEKMAIYKHGVGAGPDYNGVSDTYFPLRKGGRVTLYQDAHVHDTSLPNLKLDGNVRHKHRSCWLDIFDAIYQARRLVYITGWSVDHNVTLVRTNNDGKDITLGKLLKTKTQGGVRVLLLLWDDPTSKSILGYKTEGIMNTRARATQDFFKHSTVQVILCPRSGGKEQSFIKKQAVRTIYTHHQKTVIVDADAGENRRKIIAFVGGLDLCKGRYDTPQHSVLRTLQTTHKDDYHNPTFAEHVAGCPREPWHDLHCQIDGPAAYDILTNFEERWQEASDPQDDALLKIEWIPEIIGKTEAPGLTEDDPEAWHVQVFRSIDSSSVKGFPEDPKEAPSRNLLCGKNVLIDMSIHTAYIEAIRAAQHFIYIENQYFLGSSFNWDSRKDIGANNLIPMEIALKIANKIRAKERFAAYILIPMWPEGVPSRCPTQRILYWQRKTMQMMYGTIYEALVEAELENKYEPQDYLNFFCLGNREALDRENSLNAQTSTPGNPRQASSKKNGRFMIYVHSKGIIVDDEYVILGSANMNQRSMKGTRDTEIAMGAYQPQHTWAKKRCHPRGQIYGYRMSLWAEHMGGLKRCFGQPESLKCVRRVRSLGELNWKQFADEKVTEMKAHLLKYPVEVDRTGKVGALPGCAKFPDVGGNILGSFTAIQENLTI